jgi:hypothetical protein
MTNLYGLPDDIPDACESAAQAINEKIGGRAAMPFACNDRGGRWPHDLVSLT